MGQDKFLDNPNYMDCVRLIKEYHLLKASGKENTDEAEAIRDTMDRPWYKLSEQEMTRVQILSAGLAMLEGDEIFRSVPAEQRSREWLEPRLQAAVERENWAMALELLRNGPDFLSSDQLAYLRGQCYGNLGHPDIALLFYQYAAKHNPQYYQAFVLESLMHLGKTEEAKKFASELIADENASIRQLLVAADVLFQLTRPMPEQEARAVFQDILSSLGRVKSMEKEFAVPVLVMRGICYERLGQIEEAMEAYTQALEVDPENEGAYTARGLLRHVSNPEAAAADFEQAIIRNTPSVSPYIFLAYRALGEQNYGKALQMCQRALNIAVRPTTIARILGWMAIARDRLNAPSNEVKRLFEMALSYDPLNEEIRRNYGIFQERKEAQMPQNGVHISEESQQDKTDKKANESVNYDISAPSLENIQREVKERLPSMLAAA